MFTRTAVKELTYKSFEDEYWSDDGLQEEIVNELFFFCWQS